MSKNFGDASLLIEALFPGEIIISAERIAGGGNNRIYKVIKEDGTPFIVKNYFRNEHDPRNRLEADFSSHYFLWKYGERCIAEPLARNEKNSCAAFEYIDGEKRNASALTEDDLMEAVQFAKRLKTYSQDPSASMIFGAASEAVFSFTDLLRNIENRIQRIKSQGRASKAIFEKYQHEFNKLESLFLLIRDYVLNHLKEYGDAGASLELSARTLSPSDFGFHNALWRPSGWVFLDFEYFGWDDPAKLVSDFVLHPGMQLGESLQRYFVQASVEIYHRGAEEKDFVRRLSLMYPLFGLKWCCILLNEFIPEFRARRGFAGELDDANLDIRLAQQLQKASAMMQLVETRYDRFYSFFGISC